MFNIREGVRRAADQIPAQARQLPEFGQYSKVAECAIKDYDLMLDEYYEARGWDRETGIPTKESLRRLGLGDFAES
jgi:aldehyde:ferredoxin oxidoreductase